MKTVLNIALTPITIIIYALYLPFMIIKDIFKNILALPALLMILYKGVAIYHDDENDDKNDKEKQFYEYALKVAADFDLVNAAQIEKYKEKYIKGRS